MSVCVRVCLCELRVEARAISQVVKGESHDVIGWGVGFNTFPASNLGLLLLFLSFIYASHFTTCYILLQCNTVKGSNIQPAAGPRVKF